MLFSSPTFATVAVTLPFPFRVTVRLNDCDTKSAKLFGNSQDFVYILLFHNDAHDDVSVIVFVSRKVSVSKLFFNSVHTRHCFCLKHETRRCVQKSNVGPADHNKAMCNVLLI